MQDNQNQNNTDQYVNRNTFNTDVLPKTCTGVGPQSRVSPQSQVHNLYEFFYTIRIADVEFLYGFFTIRIIRIAAFKVEMKRMLKKYKK